MNLKKTKTVIFFYSRSIAKQTHCERKENVSGRERERGGKTLEGKHVRDAVTSMTQAGTSSHDPERL